MLLKVSRSLLRSPALRAAVVLGGGGLALAIGNLLLARFLTKAEFALFYLVYTLIMMGISIGPMGADVILTRHRIIPDGKLHRQILLTSSLTALGIVVFGHFMYPLRLELLACVFVASVAGAVKTIPVAYYRSEQRFSTALTLTVSTNMSVMIAALIAWWLQAQSALWPAIGMTLTLLATGFIGWRSIAGVTGAGPAGPGYTWAEGFSAMSFSAFGMILGSVDRLVLPDLLGLSALATFSVLATAVGSPFQMLHLGVGYTLLPALRNAPGRERRIRVLAHEAMVIAVCCAGASLVVLWTTPLILKYVLADRYQIGPELIWASVVVGVLKVTGSLMASVVNALGTSRQLAQLSGIGAVAILLSLVGAYVGSRWGLVGLIYGVSAGWLFRALATVKLAMPRLLHKEA